MKLILVDDHAAVRQATALALMHRLDCEIAASVGTGQEALDAIQRHPDVDIVLLDLELEQVQGFDPVQIARSAHEVGTHVVVYSAHSEAIWVCRMVDDVSVEGYIHKGDGLDELAAALSAVESGASYYSRRVTRVQTTVRSLGLDCAELETLQLYALNLTGEEIAARQHCSDRTLRRRMQHIKKALHLPNGMKNALVALVARRRGLIV